VTPAYTIDTVAGGTVSIDPDRVLFRDSTTGWTSSAVSGGSDTAFVDIDDPDGELDIEVGQGFWVDENDCTPERIWTGEVVSFTVDRGNYRDGPGRVWHLEMVGINAGAMFRVLSERDTAKRPPETNLERIDWLLGTTAVTGASTIFADDGFISGTAFDVDESDFTGEYPADVLASLGGEFGRNWFLFWNPAENHTTLFYGAVDEGISDSTLSISNVQSDSNSTCIFPFVDAVLSRSSEEIYAGVLVKFRGNSVLVRNSATEAAYVDRHAVVSTDRIGRLSTAVTFGTRWLAEHANPRDTLTCTLILPDDQVNLLREGMRVDVKFSHLPGYDTFTTVVVRRRTVTFYPQRANSYRVKYELSATSVAGTTGGGPPGVLPFGGCSPELVQSKEGFHGNASGTTVTLDQAPAEGNLLFVWVTVLSNTLSIEWNPTGFTGLGADWVSDPSSSPKNIRCRMFYKFAGAGESATISFTSVGTPNPHVLVTEWAGVDTFESYDELLDDTDQSGDPMLFGCGPLTPPAGRAALEIAGILPSLNVNDNWNPHETQGGTTLLIGSVGSTGSDAKSWHGYKAGPAALGTPIIFAVSSSPASGISRGAAQLMAVFSGEPCASTCPPTGEFVRDQFVAYGDGTTTEFTVPCPYADGSLSIRVDNLAILAGLTELDPSAGTFSLDFAPLDAEGDAPAEAIFASYQGR